MGDCGYGRWAEARNLPSRLSGPQLASSLSLSDVGDRGLKIVDISEIAIVEIVDKRSSLSEVQYKHELESLWLAADLVGRAQVGRVRIRICKNGLIREGGVNTLRSGKQKLS